MREDVAENFLARVNGILDSDEDDLWALARAGDLNPKEDFQYSDLRGVDCRGEDLTGFDLTGADLSGANLSDAKLVGVSLAHTKLKDAILTGADMRRADLSGAEVSGASFTMADLSEADLSGVDRTRANFLKANLYGALVDDGPIIGSPTRQGPWQLTIIPERHGQVAGFWPVIKPLDYKALMGDSFRLVAHHSWGIDEHKRTHINTGNRLFVGLVGLAIGAAIGTLQRYKSRYKFVSRTTAITLSIEGVAGPTEASVDKIRMTSSETTFTSGDAASKIISEPDVVQDRVTYREY